jgi:hypothetical protein
MSNSIQNSKSILAKALAQENIQVEHDPSAKTAMFDVVNRVLILPVWENISNEVYDLLVGHEVGHALFTPDIDKGKEESSGPWTTEAERIGGNVHASYVQAIMNVVEDARIERMIKDKFPGLRRDFSIGYRQLLEQDFFGTNEKDISKMSFADRINLHFKVGVNLAVPFSDAELELVNRIENAKEFNDVIGITEDVFRFIGGSRQHVEMPKVNPEASMTNVIQNDNGEEGGSIQGGSSSQESSSSEQTQKSNTQNGDSPSINKSAETPSDKKNENPSEGGGTSASDGLAQISTQSSFNEKINTKINNRVMNVVYTTLPSMNPDRIIFPHKKANSLLTNAFASHENLGGDYTKSITAIRENYKKLNANINPLISSLIQQFEMKKAADEQKRTSVSRSGKIDCDRIFKYRVSDDIFLHYSTVADGKNHGMVMFIDWSSSMSVITRDVINQVIMLSQFCKRMGIPFDVYMFSSQFEVMYNHLGENREIRSCMDDPLRQYEGGHCRINDRHSSNNEKRKIYGCSNFMLIHILSSDMKNAEFSTACFNLYALGETISPSPNVYPSNRNYYPIRIPNCFYQGNTPLDQTILAAMKIVPEFQKKHKVQIMNTIFLTDGETGCSFFSPSHSRYYSTQDYVRSPINKKEYNVDKFETSTDAMLHIFGDVTGSTTIGFFVVANKNMRNRYFPSHLHKEKTKELNNNGFCYVPKTDNEFGYDYKTGSYQKTSKIRTVHGYDHLFVIPGNQEIEEDVETQLGNLPTGATLTRIRNAFFSAVEKRVASRSLVNRFADVISIPTKR